MWEYRIDQFESVTGGGADWLAKVKDGYSGAPVVAGGAVVAVRNTDVAIFCGRDAEIDRLLARLREPGRRVLAVVGASGSGKSSLVWAGLLPRLLPRLRPDGGPEQTGALPGSVRWRWARFTPQEEGPDDDPFRALARALAKGEDFGACRFAT